jgi:polysaccharide pyruvyl transferase WcaK-like protein
MNIGLLDHMGYGNLGDAATQDALIANIKKRVPGVEFVGFSLNPDDTQERHQIRCYPIKRWHPGLMKTAQSGAGTGSDRRPWSVKALIGRMPVVGTVARGGSQLLQEITHIVRSFKVVRALDVLIVSGGGQLGDLWRGPWQHPYNVLKFALLARLTNRKLIFVNVGAGPLRHPLSRLFVKSAVRMGHYVSFRDVESQALVQSLGVKSPTRVFPDSVYALDIPAPAAQRPRGSRPLVGLNPIGYADPRIWPRPDAAVYSRYLDKLTAFSLWLLAQGYDLRVFSAERSVDEHAIEDLKGRLARSLSPQAIDVIVGAPSKRVSDLVAEMSTFDFVVTSKFHGVVFSHMLGKPVLALSYHNKIDDLMRAAGHTEYCLGVEDFELGQLQQLFLSLVENGDGMKRGFQQLVAARADELRQQFDELCRPEHLQGRHPLGGHAEPQVASSIQR